LVLSRERELIEELNFWVESVNKWSVGGKTLLVVEGERDAAALRSLGVEGRIVTVRWLKKARFENLSDERALLLTDFDREGTKLFNELSLLLERRGAKVDRHFRERLGFILRKLGIYQIQSLRTHPWLEQKRTP